MRVDKIYTNLINKVLILGELKETRTQFKAYSYPQVVLEYNLEKEFPILQSKFVAFKTAVKELLWIYSGNNSVKDLQSQNVHIWDEWEKEDGTIGTSYGWIVNKFDLVNKLINQIRTNPNDRRMIMNLWQDEYLDGGALYPCAFMTMWNVQRGKLNCTLIQRSADLGYGVPFNIVQYAVLVHLIAQVTGLKVGKLVHVINDCHVYTNQISGLLDQVNDWKEKGCLFTNQVPKLKINPNIKEFEDFTIDDINLENYTHLGKRYLGDVAI